MLLRAAFVFVLIRRRPWSTLTYTPFPYTSPFLSPVHPKIEARPCPTMVKEGFTRRPSTPRPPAARSAFRAPASPVRHSAPQPPAPAPPARCATSRSEEHTSELQSLMRSSYADFCLKKKNIHTRTNQHNDNYT